MVLHVVVVLHELVIAGCSYGWLTFVVNGAFLCAMLGCLPDAATTRMTAQYIQPFFQADMRSVLPTSASADQLVGFCDQGPLFFRQPAESSPACR